MASTVMARLNTDQPRSSGETGRERTAALDLAVAQKRALRASLAHKADAVAPEIGLTARVLRCAVQEDTESQLPFRRVPALLQAAPDPMPLLDFWASLCGCVVFKLPVGVEAKPMADAMRQYADVLDAHSDGIDDGRWESAEVDRFERESQEAIAALLAAVAHARAASRRTA